MFVKLCIAPLKRGLVMQKALDISERVPPDVGKAGI